MSDKQGSWEGIYEKLQDVAHDMSERFGFDEYTLANLIIGDFDASLRKMQGGYKETPQTYAHVQAIKTNEAGNTLLTMAKGKNTKDIELTGGIQSVDLSDLDDNPGPKERK